MKLLALMLLVLFLAGGAVFGHMVLTVADAVFGHARNSARDLRCRTENRDLREFREGRHEAMRAKEDFAREARRQASEARREARQVQMDFAREHHEFVRDQAREAQEIARQLREELRRDLAQVY